LVDSQEFKQILDRVADEDNYKGTWESEITYYRNDVVVGADGKNYTVIVDQVSGIAPPNANYYVLADSLRDIISTYDREMQITQAVLNQAEDDAPKSGYDITRFYTVQRDEEGNIELALSSADDVLVPSTDPNGNAIVDDQGNEVYMAVSASSQFQTAEQEGYQGYLVGDGVPPNGAAFTSGIAFPINAIKGQFALRTDYHPNRLFRYDGTRWVKIEDNIRMTMSNLGSSDVAVGADFEGKEVRQNQKSTFINNNNTAVINGKVIKERQSLSKALRPEADE
jgi:hypothetical protein